MAEKQMQQQGQTLRSGYFNKDAYQKKANSLLVLQTGIAGMQYYVNENTEEGQELLDSLTPGTELHLFREPDNEHDWLSYRIRETNTSEYFQSLFWKN